MLKIISLSLILSGLLGLCFSESIADHGAVPNVESDEAAMQNSRAIQLAFQTANTSETDREVLVPAGSQYYFGPVTVSYAKNMVLRVEGNL